MKNKFQTADIYVTDNRTTTYLADNVWAENTTALLHAPRNAGKTSVAIDMALRLTDGGREVFYLTAGRLPLSELSKVADNKRLYIHSPEFASADDERDYADIVIADIEEAIAVTDARIFIVDSLTRIAALSFGRNSSAAYIMKRLLALQVRHKISLLVIARDCTKASSRALVNLADSEILLDEADDDAPQSVTDKAVDMVKTDGKDIAVDTDFKPSDIAVSRRKNLSRRERRMLRRRNQAVAGGQSTER